VVGKETGLTSYIERFNNTLRQRVSRLVRKTLSFSKNLSNHIGVIWNFIHHYNEHRQRITSLNQSIFSILS
ncbi:IS1 family transposase, partial [Trichocoleus desertorum AS-A10]|uniref:IS1 family transposase n=1 Tax=Trichocoleus desertorum TaxID=1481672 RepID=UPI003296811C